mmetsp:Transcript_1035/g.3408  ORF Transcript_1035/g.3408 Transcript_1035/m.3408 type:complete len:424 (+) Transcript_1035:707-1978(+)
MRQRGVPLHVPRHRHDGRRVPRHGHERRGRGAHGVGRGDGRGRRRRREPDARRVRGSRRGRAGPLPAAAEPLLPRGARLRAGPGPVLRAGPAVDGAPVDVARAAERPRAAPRGGLQRLREPRGRRPARAPLRPRGRRGGDVRRPVRRVRGDGAVRRRRALAAGRGEELARGRGRAAPAARGAGPARARGPELEDVRAAGAVLRGGGRGDGPRPARGARGAPDPRGPLLRVRAHRRRPVADGPDLPAAVHGRGRDARRDARREPVARRGEPPRRQGRAARGALPRRRRRPGGDGPAVVVPGPLLRRRRRRGAPEGDGAVPRPLPPVPRLLVGHGGHDARHPGRRHPRQPLRRRRRPRRRRLPPPRGDRRAARRDLEDVPRLPGPPLDAVRHPRRVDGAPEAQARAGLQARVARAPRPLYISSSS